MKTEQIQHRKWITTCLMALLTFCLVLTGIFFIAPIKAEAADIPGIYETGNSYRIYDTVTLESGTYSCDDYLTIVGGSGDNTHSAFVIPENANVTLQISGSLDFHIPDSCNIYKMFDVKKGASFKLQFTNYNAYITISSENDNYYEGNSDIIIVDTESGSNVTLKWVKNLSMLSCESGYSGKSPINVATGATMTIDYCDFIGLYSVNGGAIQNSGTLNVVDSTFTSCMATESGGAIYQANVTGAKTTINGNTTFETCYANDGGAVYIAGGNGFDIYATDTDKICFSENYAKNRGGAIYAEATTNGTQIYGNVVFQNNSAKATGGAIYGSNMWIGRQSGVTSRVSITSNSAGTYGGGIATVNKIYLGRVDVTNNTAGSDTSTTSGGGIYTEGLFAVTSTTNISNNQSIGYGGGIYVTSTGTLQIEYMPYIDGNTNTNNEASDIYLSHNADSGASAKIKIINSLHKTADSGTMAVPIGLRVGKTGTAITTGWANAAQAISDVFVSEVSGKALYVDNSNELYVDTGYLVTIDPNDGATTGTSGYRASITWADTASYRPSRTGYTFKGWTTKKDDASTLVLSASNTTYTPTANVTLYGLWEAKTYSITYNLNGGSVQGWTPTNFTATYGESYMLVPSTTPTRSGYTFAGWKLTYTGKSNPITIDLPAKYIGATIPFDMTYGNLTIKAAWTERTVSSISVPAAYKTQSYFVGDGLKSFKITVAYDNGETATVTVTADMVSNFSTATETTSAKTATITYGGKTVNFTYTVSAGYAYRVEHYQENADDDEYTLVSADTQTLYGVGTTAATAKTYTGFTAQSFSQVSINEDGSTVIKIYYKRNVYTITFDMQGGSGGTTEVTIKHGQTSFSGLVPPTKAGYTFNGYYTQMNGGGKRWFDEDVMEEVPDTTANATVYAYWTERLIEKLTIPAASQNQSYVAGDAFVPFNITATYDNGETETVQVTASMLDNFSTESAVEGATATVNYGGKTATFTYTVTNGYAYTVKHYQKNLNDDDYTLKDTQTLYGVGTTNAAALTYEGFTAQAFEQTTIAEDGSTVVEIYYTRNSYTITLHLENGQDDVVVDFVYGEITYADLLDIQDENEPTRSGWYFISWKTKKPSYILGGQPDTEYAPLPDLPIPLSNNFEYWAYYGMNNVEVTKQPQDITVIYNGESHTLSVDVSQDGNSDFAVVYQWQISTDGTTWNDIVGATSSSISVQSVSDSGKYRVNVTVYHEEVAENRKSVSATSNEVTVTISKANQTITLSEDEFTYSEGLTFDFADYIGGSGDGTLSYAVSAQNGVTFDFANGVVSNITKAGGTFTLTVTKAATDNYNSATQTFTVTLNKGTQTLSVSGSPNPPTWKQQYQISVSGNKGALSYAIISGNGTVNNQGVITATGAGQVRYTVTAAETDFYDAATQTFTVTFGKAAGNLAPDYELPTGLTVCVGKSTNDITLPTGWSFATTTTFNSTGAKNVTAKFTPSDTTNYNVYTISLTITVEGHTGGTAASCTSDQTCTKCGDVLVEALGHNYTERVDNTVRTTAQNCQEYTTYWYDCSRCGESAKNDASATDKWYTSNEAGAHSMSSDWTSENGQHFHKCTVDGCTYTDTKVSCSGGMATCQTPAICSVCQKPYGNVSYSHFYDTSEWGYKGTDGHAHKCEYCDAHDTVVGHTPNVDAATEDVAKYCTVCQFVIEQKLNHVHVEGTEWEYNSEYHWHDCVGDDGQEYSKAKHTYDNDCDTTCNVCGASRTITHNYTKLEKSATEHWYVCSVCNAEQPNSRKGHSGGTSNCQTKANCATCGQSYGELGDHSYNTTVWVKVDNDYHAHKCTLCDAYKDATDHYSVDEANCNDAKLCDSCNYKMEEALGHSYTKQIESPAYLKAEGENCQSHHTYYYACVRCDASSKNDTNESYEGFAAGAHKMSATWTTDYDTETGAGWHYHECTVDGCGYKEDEGDCAGGEATCLVKAVCSTCQKAYGTLAEHTFGNTWEYKDANGHAHVCTVKGCNAHDEIKSHTPDIPAATEGSAQYCTACQYQMAAQLNHTHSPATEWSSNDTHHWKACGGCSEHLDEATHSYDPNNACDTTCEVCGAVREVTHDFTGAWEKDASGHWHVCAKNGCSVTDTKQNHESAGSATETDPEVCRICGWVINPALGHTTHTPEADWQRNETHHWRECTGCDGQQLEKAAHADNNKDGDCDTCAFAMGTNPSHTHSFGTTWVTDESNHWKECECEEKSELNAHVDGNSDGSCDTCGYAMGTTPPPHTHSHGSTWMTDANEHWNECECGDKANKAAHADGDGDGKCDTCNYEVGTGTPIDPDPPVDPGDDEGGLGTGAIIAIVVAAVAVVGGGGFAIFWFVIRKRRR